MAFDFYPTPAETAKRLVSHLTVPRPKVIADFSAGTGNLLYPAAERWPLAKIAAFDVQARFTRVLREQNPHWAVGTCNFLNPKSTRSCKSLRSLQGVVDAIVLNPPFSREALERHHAEPRGKNIAIEFLKGATNYLSPDGQISAILPSGVVFGDKYSCGLALPGKKIEVVEVLERGSFEGCAAQSVIVLVSAQPQESRKAIAATKSAESRPTIFLKRGCLQVHSFAPSRARDAVRFVHSTDLKDGRVSLSGPLTNFPRSRVSGPAVLLHRVGRPDASKICILGKGREVVVSDCVMALLPLSDVSVSQIRRTLLLNFEHLASCYSGTGAPYLTLKRLSDFLTTLSYQ